MSSLFVLDAETVVRWIVPKKDWYEPPERPTTLNFKLRRGERGLSVYRTRLTDEADLRKRLNVPDEAMFLSATVGDIRSLTKADGTALNLDVEADDPDRSNPGHAVIVAPDGNITAAAAKALRDCFTRAEGAG